MKYLYLLVAAVLLSSCGSLGRIQRKQQVYVRPMPMYLQERNGQVNVDFQIVIPRNYMGNNASLVLTPVFLSSQNRYPLRRIVIEGNQYRRVEGRRRFYDRAYATDDGNTTVLPYTKDSLIIRYHDALPYGKWLINSILSLEVDARACGRTVRVMNLTLAYGVAPRTDTVVLEVRPLPADTLRRENAMTGYIYFPVSESTVEPGFEENAMNLGRIRDMVTSPDVRIDRIDVVGSASPDGDYDFNERLSNARATAFANYLTDRCGVPETRVYTRWVGENWPQLRDLIEKSYLENRGSILSIINDPYLVGNEKQERMEDLSLYDYLLTTYYPLLRNVKCTIYYTPVSEKDLQGLTY